MADLVLDNGAPGTKATGSWEPSQATDSFGPNSLFAYQGQNFYRWTPTIATEGDYDVSVWFSTHANRGAAVPISVTHAAGVTPKIFNEKPGQGGGQWVLHGRYHFLAGTSGYVETNSVAGQAAADAVKFAPVPVFVPSATPSGRIDFVSPAGVVASLTLPPNVVITVTPN